MTTESNFIDPIFLSSYCPISLCRKFEENFKTITINLKGSSKSQSQLSLLLSLTFSIHTFVFTYLLKLPLSRLPMISMLPNPMITFNPQLLNLSRAFAPGILLETSIVSPADLLLSHRAEWLLLFSCLGRIILSFSSSKCGVPRALSSQLPVYPHFCDDLFQHHDFKFCH